MNELTINLHTASETPLYEQIYQHIKREIQEGRITSGEKLPSSRSLCKYLEVSRSTVELAYEQLISEGYVEAVPCKGYFAAELEGMYRLDVVPALVGAEEKTEKKEWKYNFTPNGVDLNSFPYNVWRRLAKDSLLDDRAEMFRLGDSQGEYGLRSAISRYLYQARGVNAHPDQIIIGAGNDYLLMLLSTVIGQNHKVALENPTYKQAYRLFKSLSYDVCTVDMDEKGMKVANLKSSGADIAFVMPSHQYPLGIVMPMKRRMELLKWAAKDPARYIIEDDYDSEFRYKGKPIPALQGMDRGGRVIYMGTFSKSIAPAIRVGFMVLPEHLLEAYRERAGFYLSTVSRIDQNILYQFITQGYYERHLNRMRALYKGKHDALMAGLKELEDRFLIRGEYAGLHVLLTHRQGEAEESLVARAAELGVKVYGISGCFIQPEEKLFDSTVMLGYASLSEEEIRNGAKLLAKAWTF